MKHQTFFITRWWRGLALQTRLFLAFTFLFVFSILALSLFLNNVIQMIRLNRETQVTFEQNQQIYRFKDSVARYQLALKYYENSETERSYTLAEQALKTYGKQVADDFSHLSDQIEIEQAQIDQFNRSKSEIDTITTQVKQAIDSALSSPATADAEWNKVLTLDEAANKSFGEMNQVADRLQNQGQQDLAVAKEEAAHISDSSFLTGLIAFPVFLLLAALTALVIYRQINQPLQQLTEAAQAVQADSFQPQLLDKLAERGGEIGTITRLFVHMAESIDDRSASLRQEADAIRAKIR